MADDDLRGSTPVYTAKDVLVRLDDRVEKMDSKMDVLGTSMQIILSQNLNDRLLRIEAAEQARAGAYGMLKIMFGTSVIGLIAALAGIAKAFGLI